MERKRNYGESIQYKDVHWFEEKLQELTSKRPQWGDIVRFIGLAISADATVYLQPANGRVISTATDYSPSEATVVIEKTDTSGKKVRHGVSRDMGSSVYPKTRIEDNKLIVALDGIFIDGPIQFIVCPKSKFMYVFEIITKDENKKAYMGMAETHTGKAIDGGEITIDRAEVSFRTKGCNGSIVLNVDARYRTDKTVLDRPFFAKIQLTSSCFHISHDRVWTLETYDQYEVETAFEWVAGKIGVIDTSPTSTNEEEEEQAFNNIMEKIDCSSHQ